MANFGTFGSFGGTTTSTSSQYSLGYQLYSPPPMQPTPRLHGAGPLTCSTSQELAPHPLYVWDTNGYYGDLGVPTDATRKQLRHAYLAGDGQSSRRMTFCLKQLLDPVIRRRYDSVPLGSRLVDVYVAEELMREAHKRAADQGTATGVASDPMEHLRDMMGDQAEKVASRDTDDSPPEGLDSEDDGASNLASQRTPFGYSIVLLGPVPEDVDLDRAAEWQEMLVSALARRRVRTRLAIGYHGTRPDPWLIAIVGDEQQPVILLRHDATPTAALAKAAAAAASPRLKIARRHYLRGTT